MCCEALWYPHDSLANFSLQTTCTIKTTHVHMYAALVSLRKAWIEGWHLYIILCTGLWMLHSASLQTVWGVHERSTNYSFITSNSIVHVTPFNHNGSTCTEHVHVHTCMCTCTLTKHWSGFMTTCKEPPILNGVFWMSDENRLMKLNYCCEKHSHMKNDRDWKLSIKHIWSQHKYMLYMCTGVQV